MLELNSSEKNSDKLHELNSFILDIDCIFDMSELEVPIVVLQKSDESIQSFVYLIESKKMHHMLVSDSQLLFFLFGLVLNYVVIVKYLV